MEEVEDPTSEKGIIGIRDGFDEGVAEDRYGTWMSLKGFTEGGEQGCLFFGVCRSIQGSRQHLQGVSRVRHPRIQHRLVRY